MVVAIFCNSSKIVSRLVQGLKVGLVNQSPLGLKVVLVNQSLVRYELVPLG
jgi:hypothetical protein